MKMYKGFNKDMASYHDFQFEEGKTYEEPAAGLRGMGFYACEDPLDCFENYPPATSVFHEVELGGVIEDFGVGDTRREGKRITIGAELSVEDIATAHFEYVKKKITKTVEKGYRAIVEVEDGQEAIVGCNSIANAGDGGIAKAGCEGLSNAGYGGIAKVGDNGIAKAGINGVSHAGPGGIAIAEADSVSIACSYGIAEAGDRSLVKAGVHGVARAGYGGRAIAGFCGIAIAEDDGFAQTDDWGISITGDDGISKTGLCGISISRGASESYEQGLSIARGNNVKAKGDIGSLLVVVKESLGSTNIESYAVGLVDGEKIKANTWYKCENGKLVEAEVEE